MTRAGKFCLAGALFGWPAADGYQSPGQTAPDSWRAQFIKTAGGWALAGLFSSCRSGRDMVLEQAPKASLREDASFSTLLQAKKRLKTRSNTVVSGNKVKGGMMSLRLDVSSNESSIAALQLLPGLLHGPAGKGITQLEVYRCMFKASPNQETTSAFLQSAVVSFPALTKLTLLNCPAILPHPNQLPHLKELTLTDPRTEHANIRNFYGYISDHSVCNSVGRFLPQLRSLSIRGYTGENGEGICALFTGQNTSSTLTYLYTDAVLSKRLIRLLCTHAPGLKQLHVKCFPANQGPGFHWRARNDSDSDGESDSVCERVWGLTELHVDKLGGETTADNLMTLPGWREGAERCEVHLSGTSSIAARSSEGLDPKLLRCLSCIEFRAGYGIHIYPCVGVLETYNDNDEMVLIRDESSALRATLSQLTELCTPCEEGMTVYLYAWEWTDQMHLNLGVHLGFSLSDEKLDLALRLAQHAPRLAVEHLALKSDTHADTPWPWKQLTIDNIYISDLCKLPDPGDTQRSIDTRELHIDYEGIQEAGLDSVLSRLASLTWSLDYGHRTVTLPYTQGGAETQCTVAKAIQWADDDQCLEDCADLTLTGWPLTHETMQLLRHLPEWDVRVCLKHCEFPLKPASEYVLLDEVIPSEYSFIKVPKKIKAAIDDHYYSIGRDSTFSRFCTE